MDRVRVVFLGVKPEYQHTGVAAKLYGEHFDTAARTPTEWGEMGWILETNRNMNRAMEAMGGRIVRRFRVYERVCGARRTFTVEAPNGYIQLCPAAHRGSEGLPADVPVALAGPLHARPPGRAGAASTCRRSSMLFVIGVRRVGLLLRRRASPLGGYAFWTLTEYWLHRIVFHFEPERTGSARGCTG